jgi:ligand-binding SRPBCC domain-containing protein
VARAPRILSPRDRHLERTQVVPVPLEAAWAFFSDPANLEAITPPWLRFRIVEAPDRLEAGSLLRYRLSLFRVPIRWRTEIREWTPPRSFVDVQVSGPYRVWEHTHRLAPVEGGTEIHDHVRWRAPAGTPLVQRWVDAIFDYRAERLRELLGR